jgi:hypothetical protein
MRSAWLAALFVFGCQSEPFPAPITGTTYRISKDEPAGDSEVTIDILTTLDECINAKVQGVEDCVPFVDRAAGEVRLAFELRDPATSETIYRALDAPQIKLTHDGRGQEDMAFIPHEPMNAGQLFILVIDGSGSMQEVDAHSRSVTGRSGRRCI